MAIPRALQMLRGFSSAIYGGGQEGEDRKGFIISLSAVFP